MTNALTKAQARVAARQAARVGGEGGRRGGHPMRTWESRNLNAAIRGHFTKVDLGDASRWKTCAVGEMRGRYPEAVKYCSSGIPRDETLRRLGDWFNLAVICGDVPAAQKAYRAILGRVARLYTTNPIEEGTP